MEQRQIKHIIILRSELLSEREIFFYRSEKICKRYMVTFSNSRTIGYNNYIKIVNGVLQILDANPKENILIVCDKGINESIAIAMSYGILRHNYTYNKVLNAIEKGKNNKKILAQLNTSWIVLHITTFSQ